MLQTPTEFPHAGSYALWQGHKVRIQQIRADGQRLISGRSTGRHSITATVPLDELEAFTEFQHSVAAWADQRIATISFSVRTAAATAFDDYCAWHKRTLREDLAATRRSFTARLISLGHKIERLADGSKAWCFTLNAGGVS